MHEHKTGLSGHTLLMLPAASISLLTMNVAPSAAGASMDNIIQNYPGMKLYFADVLAFLASFISTILVSYINLLL